MRSLADFAVFPCCALVALLAVSTTPIHRLSGDGMEAYERQLRFRQPMSDTLGPIRDFSILGAERWALAGIAAAGVGWLSLRRRAAGRGLFRLSLLSVLTGAVSGSLGAAAHLDRHLDGHMGFQYEFVARYLAGIRLGFGLAALLVLTSLILTAWEDFGGET